MSKTETPLHSEELERILMPIMIAVDVTGESYRKAASLLLTSWTKPDGGS